MRIIAGSARGKALLSPSSDRTRPTSDRAREGLFSSLVSEFSSLSGLHFLDLFSGSGAVGVEALSRGVALVHSVESDANTGDVAIANFQLVKSPFGSYQLFRTKSERFLESDQAVEHGQYDIIFMDPPYEHSNRVVEEMLQIIVDRKLLQPTGIVAIERESKQPSFIWPVEMQEIKVRSYGQGSIYYGGYSASVLP